MMATPETVKGSDHSWTFSALSSAISSVSADLIPIILCPLSLFPSLSLPRHCYLFSAPQAGLVMLIHREMNEEQWSLWETELTHGPNIQEYIHRASLTAAWQKREWGGGVWDHTYLKRSGCVVGWHENKLQLPRDKRHRAGNSDPEMESAFLQRSGESCATSLRRRPAAEWSQGGGRRGQRAGKTWEFPLRLSSLAWCGKVTASNGDS